VSSWGVQFMSISMRLNSLSRRGASKEGGINGSKKNRARWAKGRSDEHTQAKKTPVCETGATTETFNNQGI
jgi:hypothetical protein